MFRLLRVAAFLAAGLGLSLSAFAQTTRFVDGNNGNDQGGANNCENLALPCQTISHAINESFGGDLIEIADAVYTESLSIPRSLKLQGASEELTIIQAHEFPGQASNRVVSIDGNFDVEINNLTIRHGVASGDSPANRGGGIYNNGASLTLNGVSFINNSAHRGGGMANVDGNAALVNVRFIGNDATGTDSGGGGLFNIDSTAELANVEFTSNTVSGSGCIGGPVPLTCGGGGMNNIRSSPLLTDVIFNGNSSTLGGGGMVNSVESKPVLSKVDFVLNIAASSQGGGMINRGNSDATLVNVDFIRNRADLGGGGMVNSGSSPTLNGVEFRQNRTEGDSNERGGGGMANFGSAPELSNVVFRLNTANATGLSLRGGGMLNNDSSPILKNVEFIDNGATTGGGMFDGNGSSSNLINTIFYSNQAQGGGGLATIDSTVTMVNVTFNGNGAFEGGAIFSLSSSVVLRNAILWGNTASGDGNEICVGGSLELFYSLYRDSEGDICAGGAKLVAKNSLTVDPLFMNPENGDLRLTEGSPAIDSGDPTTNPLIFPTDENNQPIDLLGNSRFFPAIGEVDMGAIEWQPLVDEIFRDRFEEKR